MKKSENKIIYMNIPRNDSPDPEKRLNQKTPAELIELRTVIARGDYEVPAMEIAKKMLSARVFHSRKHG